MGSSRSRLCTQRLVVGYNDMICCPWWAIFVHLRRGMRSLPLLILSFPPSFFFFFYFPFVVVEKVQAWDWTSMANEQYAPWTESFIG